MNAYDREAIRTIIEPWLDTTARQVTSKPGKFPLVDDAARALRAGTGLAILGFNLVTAMIQATGLSMSKTEVKQRYYWAGMGQFLRNPGQAWRDAADRSVRMDDRLRTHTHKIQEYLNRHSAAPFRRGAIGVRDATGHLAWGPMRIMQGMVDVITWHGAYQQSIAESPADADMDMVEKRAAHDADLAVERSQGGFTPESRARHQVDTPVMQLFHQFMSFGNNLMNKMLTESALKKTKVGRFATFLWIPITLSLWETAIRSVAEGWPEDEDDDGPLDELAKRYAINLTRNVVGVIPFVGGSAASAMTGESARIGGVPAISAVKSGVRGITSLFDDKEGVNVDDLGMMLTIFTGIPIRAVTKHGEYMLKVQSGEVQPTSDLDFVRGALTGRASEGSRR